jgi:hypothetical protein
MAQWIWTVRHSAPILLFLTLPTLGMQPSSLRSHICCRFWRCLGRHAQTNKSGCAHQGCAGCVSCGFEAGVVCVAPHAVCHGVDQHACRQPQALLKRAVLVSISLEWGCGQRVQSWSTLPGAHASQHACHSSTLAVLAYSSTDMVSALALSPSQLPSFLYYCVGILLHGLLTIVSWRQLCGCVC